MNLKTEIEDEEEISEENIKNIEETTEAVKNCERSLVIIKPDGIVKKSCWKDNFKIRGSRS